MSKKSKVPETSKMVDGTVFTVRLDQLVYKYKTREENPNKMDDTQFAILKESIRTEGFLQPVLVKPLGNQRFMVLDGHHRSWASEEVGRVEITAVVKTASDPKALALSIGMNKIRGELDYGMAADVLKQLSDGTDWSNDQISLLTGFSVEEIEALVTQGQPEADELLEEVASAPSEAEEKPEETPKPFVLEISFDSRENYRLARRKLKKAAGKGGDLALGLLNVLGELEINREEAS